MTHARFLPLKFLYTLAGPVSISVVIKQMWGVGGEWRSDKGRSIVSVIRHALIPSKRCLSQLSGYI